MVRGYGGFESWDETYVHTRHNDRDRTVLEHREDGEGRLAVEPACVRALRDERLSHEPRVAVREQGEEDGIGREVYHPAAGCGFMAQVLL